MPLLTVVSNAVIAPPVPALPVLLIEPFFILNIFHRGKKVNSHRGSTHKIELSIIFFAITLLLKIKLVTQF